MEKELSRIAEIAKEDKKLKFISLAHLLNEQNLTECFYLLKKDRASGVDKVTLGEYEANLENNLKLLVGKLKNKGYTPKPVRRVYIPKANGKLRPLGIPAVEDKIVQMAVTRILNAIYEQDFLECSYGFRPKRGCHDALKALNRMITGRPVEYIIDADIKGFFDNVDHEIMIKLLEIRVADSTLLQLIKRFLKGGVMEEGKYMDTEKGTPQGGILSPILANIYLHYALDKWIECGKTAVVGYIGMVRYADDFVICTRLKNTVRKTLSALKARLAIFKLELAEEKTRLIEFGRFAEKRAQKKGGRTDTFNFLGFTHYCTKSRSKRFKIGYKTDKKKLQQKLKDMDSWLGLVINQQIRDWWPILKSKIIGHYRYYGISENGQSIKRFFFVVKGILFRRLNSRSQRKSFNWQQFHKYLNRFTLPVPKIYHSFYVYSNQVSIDEEPIAGNLHDGFCEGEGA